jgi:signal transduction histidine kinase
VHERSTVEADTTRESLRENVLLDLAKRDHRNTIEAFQSITEATAVALAVERVSIWRLLPQATGIACEDLFTLSTHRHEHGLVLWARDYPRYFEALLENRTIPADDARRDSRTEEFAQSYLEPRGITSMMDVPIWHQGSLYGILCHEHLGPPRHWREDEEALAGNLADLVALSLERSERRRIENRWESVLEQIAEAVFVLDRKGKVLQMNPRGRDLLDRVGGGRRHEDRLAAFEYRDRKGRPIPRDQQPILRARRGEQNRDVLTIWNQHAGFLGSFNVLATPIIENGIVESVVVVLQDVTDEVRVDQLKAEFLSTLAHELKTPAAVVKGFTQLLMRDPKVPAALRERLGTIDQASERTERLIDDAVEMAGLTVGRLALSREPVELRSIVSAVIASIPATLQTHPTRLVSPAWIEISADRARIEQVIRRLVENAIRYSPDGGPIDVQIVDEPARVTVTVCDRGIGISEARRSHIFEAFTCADDDIPNGGGLGIGLYLTREIVRLHGGEMSCESVEGQGTTFAFWLPRGVTA